MRVETDGSAPAVRAAEILRNHVVLMCGAALPERGPAAALRIERTGFAGYEIREDGAGGARIAGDDPVRAVYDLLEGWGCRFDRDPPEVPRADRLALDSCARPRRRSLWIEGERLDPALPAQGLAVAGLDRYRAEQARAVHALGYRIRVVSLSFDDFLPPALFAEHPEWFALRGGSREARGNFALLQPAARAAYLGRLGAWLENHPEVDVVGIWPEITRVWDEEALTLGAAEAYALLWREAAERFPGRTFEILATGLTLEPPAGPVPANVEVRLRPGPAASRLQGLSSQPIESVVAAWEARGAGLVLEIDAAPDSFLGMPWPCQEAVRADARRFAAAVLRNGAALHARLWRDPEARWKPGPDLARLLGRAEALRSWGDPADSANLFLEESWGTAFQVAAVERLYRVAAEPAGPEEERRRAAADLYLGYRALRRSLPPEVATTYRRYRERDYRRLFDTLLPEGLEHQVGAALVREDFERMQVETGRLRLAVERRSGTVISLQRLIGGEWSEDLAGSDGSFFAVTALGSRTERTAGRVELETDDEGMLRLLLSGRLGLEGARWSTVLEFTGASGRIRQRSRVEGAGGIAVGSRWTGGPLDSWVCPAYATEGRLEGAGQRQGFVMPPGTLLYCRAGDRGPGFALRTRARTAISLVETDTVTLAASARGSTLEADWIIFEDPSELGH